MEISIADILKNEGVKKSFSFFEILEDSDIEFCGEVIKITKPMEVQGYAINYEGKIRLYMNIKTGIERTCSRCLTAYNEMIDCDAEYIFTKNPDNQNDDAYLLKGDSIALDELVMDEITSQMSMKPLCKPDCKGLCPRCGENKNINECSCILDEVDPRLQILSSFLEKK